MAILLHQTIIITVGHCSGNRGTCKLAPMKVTMFLSLHAFRMAISR